MSTPDSFILIRGGGDLASGVALRLRHAGISVLITERAQPLAVRRLVSFAEAVYQGETSIEGLVARRVKTFAKARACLTAGEIPVLADPNLDSFRNSEALFPIPLAIVDARMTKRPPEPSLDLAPLVIGLGPGFIAGENCHAAIETNRGHFLGRVIWDGAPEADTGVPGKVAQRQLDRVLRAPADGVFTSHVKIGSPVRVGEIVAEVSGATIIAPFDGILRGLLHPGLPVRRGLKVGDIDPRNDPRFAALVSEKSLAIGGGVLEALLTRPEVRARLWI